MSETIWMVLGLAMLPALGNFLGGVGALWIVPTGRFLNRVLHIAVGIMLAVISIEIMPEALKKASPWLLAPAFIIGGCIYLALETLVEKSQKNGVGMGVRSWMIYAAVMTDLIADGLLIGAGSAVSFRIGFIVALGQVIADIPEGFVVVSNFRHKGISRWEGLILSASFMIPVVVSALLTFFLLRDQGANIQMFSLVLVSGLYLLAAVEDMMSEAHESAEDTRWSAFCLLLGFGLFMLLSGIVP